MLEHPGLNLYMALVDRGSHMGHMGNGHWWKIKQQIMPFSLSWTSIIYQLFLSPIWFRGDFEVHPQGFSHHHSMEVGVKIGTEIPLFNIISFSSLKKHKHSGENLHRSCVLTGGLCFMDWAPPNRHQTLHFGPKRNHAILMDSWLTGGTKKINHKAMQVWVTLIIIHVTYNYNL